MRELVLFGFPDAGAARDAVQHMAALLVQPDGGCLHGAFIHRDQRGSLSVESLESMRLCGQRTAGRNDISRETGKEQDLIAPTGQLARGAAGMAFFLGLIDAAGYATETGRAVLLLDAPQDQAADMRATLAGSGALDVRPIRQRTGSRAVRQ